MALGELFMSTGSTLPTGGSPVDFRPNSEAVSPPHKPRPTPDSNTLPALAEAPGVKSTEEVSDSWLLEQFVARQDPAAFEALVRRHGPIVLAVCRRVLQNEHAAEDAFQATFLVLARKAPSLANPELLANWLHGVARRTAARARVQEARRRVYEACTACSLRADPLVEVFGRDLSSMLAAALALLPEKYRAPLVLCYLEGKTNCQAASQLGWPVGSISGRLARGREILHRQLTRRGWETVL
jgi:RNA polymerase sigma factor (sigma-70 family)